MNIYASKGHEIICNTLEGGYEYDEEKARKYLNVGVIYTVEKTDVHNFNTDVYLQEIPGVCFNSVFFEDLDKFESENNYNYTPDLKSFSETKNKFTTDSGKYTKFNTDKKNIKFDDRQRKITELLSKFKNGEELYKRNPVFHQVIQMLLGGCDEYEVIEQLILTTDRTQKAFEDYIVRDFRPRDIYGHNIEYK